MFRKFFFNTSENRNDFVKKEACTGLYAVAWKTKYSLCLCRLITWFSPWLYQSLTFLWRNFGPLLLTTSLQFTDVCRQSFMHSSLTVMPQHFNRFEVWILAGPLKHLLFSCFSHSIIDLLLYLASLSCFMNQFQLSFNLASLTLNSRILW